MEKTGGSKLLQMQARFQQKQLAEREMKIASLYEAQQARALDRVRHSPSSTNGSASSPTPAHAPIPQGKVRQMFEERRTKAGIDKSYPLQPIHNTERQQAKRPIPNGYNKVANNSKVAVERKTRTTTSRSSVTTTSSVKKLASVTNHKIEVLTNGTSDLNHNHHKADLNSNHRMNGEILNGIDVTDKGDDNYLLENETFPEALAPTQTPRTPDEEPKRPPRRSPTVKSSPPKPQPAAPPRRNTPAASTNSATKGQGSMQKTIPPVARKQSSGTSKARATTAATSAVGAESGGGAGVACSVCGRRFAADRLEKHESICRRATTKKRKPFDALKHRLAGTEAEPFINKLRKGTISNTKVNKLNNNWRQKHEEFINAIRAAKEVQAHLNAGGKLSDLPPPPPSENPDYVQCPHCQRRFNQAAAERHIPKCASYQFNKPKPNAKRR